MKQCVILSAASILLSVLQTNVGAQDQNNIPIQGQGISCQIASQNIKPPNDNRLVSLHNQAIEVGEAVCRNMLAIVPEEKAALEDNLQAFTLETQVVVNEMFAPDAFPGLAARLALWSDQVNAYYTDYQYLQFLEDGTTLKGDDFIPFWEVWSKQNDNLPRLSYELTQRRNEICAGALATAETCPEVFAQIRQAAAPFYQLISANILESNGEKLAAMQGDWNNFIRTARYQTPLDVWLTTRMHQDDYQGIDLAGPPDKQYFLLRPSLIVEHIGNAPDGEQTDLSLAIEWLGVNWWRKGFGISLTSTYRDSAQVSSVGTGLTVHINNQYSIGISHRGSNDNAIFFNVDLLALFGEKKATYEQYKQYLLSR